MRCDDMAPKGSYPQAKRLLFQYGQALLCSNNHQREVMRQCKCGGVIRQHQLVNNREAWTCNACGRYEIVELEDDDEDWIFDQMSGVREAEND